VKVPVIVALVVLLGLSAAVAGSCKGDDADVTELRTGFESRNGSKWTSPREERSFLRALDAASERVTVSEIGRSVEDRPISLVTVGAPRTRSQIAAGSSMLFVCTQHGTEPAGREGCLEAARDAVSDIGSSTLLVIPTANPDGLATGSRENADGVDINRDHTELTTPEARAIASVMHDYKPDLLGDFHEYKEPGASEVLFSNPATLHLDVDARIKQLSSQLNRYAVPVVDAARFETGLYPTLTPEADASILRQRAALRHSPSLLVETPRRGTLSAVRRVAAHRAAMSAMFKMLREQTRKLAGTTTAARQDAAAE